MPTLKEQQESLTTAQHNLAVWEVLYHYLDSSYIAKDGSSPEKAIRVPGSLREIVEEDTIEGVLEYMSTGPIKELKNRISAIENMEVVVIEKDETNGHS